MEVTGRPEDSEPYAFEDPSREDVHGEVSVLVLGREGSGRTSLVLSLEALRAGAYPRRTELKKGAAKEADAYAPAADGGRRHAVPSRVPGGPPLMLTDTQPCGARNQVRLPGGRRLPIALRSASLHHDAVLFVVDASERPLWEDAQWCEELAQLCATLRQQQYCVVIAATKLLKAREEALRQTAHGADHGGRPGRDPRRSYEEFVSRYLEKACVALQATEALKAWLATQDPGSAPFPKPGSTMLDVPTWVSVRDFEAWRERRGTAELPNLRYMEAQLEKLVAAVAAKPKMPSGSPWYHLADEGAAGGSALTAA